MNRAERVERAARVVCQAISGLDPSMLVTPCGGEPMNTPVGKVILGERSLQPLWKLYRHVGSAVIEAIDMSELT